MAYPYTALLCGTGLVEKIFKGAGGHRIEFTQSKYLLSINFVSYTTQGARPRKMKKAQALTLKTLTFLIIKK